MIGISLLLPSTQNQKPKNSKPKSISPGIQGCHNHSPFLEQDYAELSRIRLTALRKACGETGFEMKLMPSSSTPFLWMISEA